ncbi:MAG: MaoC family dehydratase N-terminal domain-containing protein [Brachymonas sp.]
MPSSQASATIDMEELRPWIGRSETMTDVLHPVPLASLSATLDTAPFALRIGQPLPPLWHWAYFLLQAPAHALGPDGHPRRGGFLPPVALPRRMWAGSRFTFEQPLCVGDTVQRISTIESIAHKQGRSGNLVFVTVRHAYRVMGNADDVATAADALTEWHDIVYRGEPQAAGSASDTALPVALPGAQHGPCEHQADGSFCQQWRADPVLLFRYSALTFNGHRIHYDRSYATQTEGYPGLVVHGPLLATLLVELVRTQWPQHQLAAYHFRALHPVFDIHPFSLHAKQADGHTVELWVQDWQGRCAMEATATLHPA